MWLTTDFTYSGYLYSEMEFNSTSNKAKRNVYVYAHLGQDGHVFHKLKNETIWEGILLVMYIAYPQQIHFMDWYRQVYSPFDIVFYAEDNNEVNKSIYNYSQQIHWTNLTIANNPNTVAWSGRPNYKGGKDRVINDWYMHKCLLDSISRYDGYDGYVFMADDVLFRYWRFEHLSRDKFWTSSPGWNATLDFMIRHPVAVLQHLDVSPLRQPYLQQYYNSTDEHYKKSIQNHFGDPSIFVQMLNNDFVFVPGVFAEKWSRICSAMTAYDLDFVTAIFQSVYAVASPSDIAYITGRYSNNINTNEHINHPIKFSKKRFRNIFENELKEQFSGSKNGTM